MSTLIHTNGSILIEMSQWRLKSTINLNRLDFQCHPCRYPAMRIYSVMFSPILASNIWPNLWDMLACIGTQCFQAGVTNLPSKSDRKDAAMPSHHFVTVIAGRSSPKFSVYVSSTILPGRGEVLISGKLSCIGQCISIYGSWVLLDHNLRRLHRLFEHHRLLQLNNPPGQPTRGTTDPITRPPLKSLLISSIFLFLFSSSSYHSIQLTQRNSCSENAST